MYQSDILGSNHYYRSNTKTYEATRENVSRETNEGVMIRCKEITDNLLTVVGLIVEPRKAIEKPKSSIGEYISISQPQQTVTSSKPFIYHYIYSFFFFISMMRSNGRSYRCILYLWSTVESYIGNSAGLCESINRTGKMKCTASKYCIYFVELIKGRYVLWRGTSISWKSMVEAI